MTAEDRKMLRLFAEEKTVNFGPRQAEVDRLVKKYGHLGKDTLRRIRKEQERITLWYTSPGSYTRVKAFEEISAVDHLLKRRQSPRETAISELRRRVENIEIIIATGTVA